MADTKGRPPYKDEKDIEAYNMRSRPRRNLLTAMGGVFGAYAGAIAVLVMGALAHGRPNLAVAGGSAAAGAAGLAALSNWMDRYNRRYYESAGLDYTIPEFRTRGSGRSSETEKSASHLPVLMGLGAANLALQIDAPFGSDRKKLRRALIRSAVFGTAGAAAGFALDKFISPGTNHTSNLGLNLRPSVSSGGSVAAASDRP